MSKTNPTETTMSHPLLTAAQLAALKIADRLDLKAWNLEATGHNDLAAYYFGRADERRARVNAELDARLAA